MTPILAVLAAGLLAGGLTYLDPKLRAAPMDRRLPVALAWPISAGLAAAFGPDELRWAVAALFLAASAGTRGRPALLTDAIHLWPAGNEHLQRRKTIGLIIMFVTLGVIGILLL